VEANSAYQALTARPAVAAHFYLRRDPATVDPVIAHIAAATQRGLTVPVGVTWVKGQQHKILVDRIEDGRVWFTNPYGTREVWPLVELTKRITNANLPVIE
jgi:hypothetical protein